MYNDNLWPLIHLLLTDISVIIDSLELSDILSNMIQLRIMIFWLQ